MARKAEYTDWVNRGFRSAVAGFPGDSMIDLTRAREPSRPQDNWMRLCRARFCISPPPPPMHLHSALERPSPNNRRCRRRSDGSLVEIHGRLFARDAHNLTLFVRGYPRRPRILPHVPWIKSSFLLYLNIFDAAPSSLLLLLHARSNEKTLLIHEINNSNFRKLMDRDDPSRNNVENNGHLRRSKIKIQRFISICRSIHTFIRPARFSFKYTGYLIN